MPQTLLQVGLPIALILIMMGVGLNLTKADFIRVAKEPKSFLIGALCQMIVLPIAALAVIALTDLSGELAVGLFILALCPGGTTSNLYSYLAKADLGLSISLTAVIGFITPFTIPLLAVWAMNYYGIANESFELPILATWLKLMIITVFPVLVGMWINAKWHTFAKRVQPFISWFSIAVLILVIISICIKLGNQLIEFTVLAGPSAILLNVVTMALGYFVGRWALNNQAQAKTITLEVGLQNGTLALLVTSSLLQSTQMSIAPSIYSLFMFFSASLFTIYARRI